MMNINLNQIYGITKQELKRKNTDHNNKNNNQQE